MYSVGHMEWEILLEGIFHSSPVAWEDQVIYFLLVDRFSDGNECGFLDNLGEPVEAGPTPAFRSRDAAGDNCGSAEVDREEWRKAGGTWCGGNLRGIATKLGYLKRLGVTTLWISPILKQAEYAPDSYHGYGTQDFLQVDPHFGTPDDFRALIRTAHDTGMYVILDVILNHAADVFAYAEQGDLVWRPEPYSIAGFRDATGQPTLPFGLVDLQQYPDAYPNGAVWPQELQHPECFTRKGRIQNWDHYPEYEEGDFFAYKDFDLETREGEDAPFEPSPALRTLTEVYKYWVAYADLDGLRIDTVKHMPSDSIAYFAREIHAFAASLGKQNFYLIGEIVGTREDACRTLLDTGIDAALGIGEVPRKIRRVVCGWANPSEYFDIFVNSQREGEEHPEPVWWRDRVITFFDDHDQVGKETKGRLASDFPGDRRKAEATVLRAVAFQVLTLGIPCLYYGTEQGFDGRAPETEPQQEGEDSATTGPTPDRSDRFVRECMFGGEFGAFQTQGYHFFDEGSRLYSEIAAMLALRQRHPVLRRGRQFVRELSEDGENFWLPDPGEEPPYLGLVAWSRMLDVDEFVCVLNTDPDTPRSAFVTVDANRRAPGSEPLECVYSTDPQWIGYRTSSPEERNGSAVWLMLPPGGVAVFR